MSNQQVAMRLIAAESGISYSKQKSGKLTESEWADYHEGAKKVKAYDIELNDLGGITLSQMRQELRRMGKVDIILVDYLQLMRAEQKHGTREQQVGEISRGLKQIAKEFNTPLIAGAQVSRGVDGRKDKRLILSDLRESGSLEQDSDIVMLINQLDKANPFIIDLAIAKHRNGAVGIVDLIFVPHLTKFENATKRKVIFQ
jgi:replicative DNA helicase